MALSAKKKKAIDFYLSGQSKVDAMRNAGYAETTAKTKHSDIFGDPEVEKEIERRQKIASTRSDVTLEWITERLKSIADANLGDILEIHDDGSASINMKLITPDLKRALTNFVIDEGEEGRGEGKMKVKRMRISLADKIRALDLLTRHLGLSKEKTVVSLEDDLVERLQRGRKRVAGSDGGDD